MTDRRPVLLAIVTFVAACAAIVAMMVLLSDHTHATVFVPLFAPAGLASWAIYRSGSDTKPPGFLRDRDGHDQRPLVLVIVALAAFVWCLVFLI